MGRWKGLLVSGGIAWAGLLAPADGKKFWHLCASPERGQAFSTYGKDLLVRLGS